LPDGVTIGLDFGGVIVKPGQTRSGEDTAEAIEGWEPQPGALRSIAILVTRFADSVYVVSKAGRRMESLTRAWLNATDFHRITGLHSKNMYFCRERAEKLTHCERLSITRFVDDRTDVMEILRHRVPVLYRFAPENERDSTPDFAIHVSNWDELVGQLLASTG
jgi:hypothetical protein